MTTTTHQVLTEVHYDPDCNPEQLEQVLRALDQWSDRTARHVTHLRQNDRHSYRTTVTVEPQPGKPAAARFRQVFHVQARNVSKNGLGFVAPPVFMPRVLCDETPLVRSEIIFGVGAPLKVRLQAPGRQPLALNAEITRLRLVHFGFFDIGVRFLARDGAGSASSN
jgi:hypothetical protein